VEPAYTQVTSALPIEFLVVRRSSASGPLRPSCGSEGFPRARRPIRDAWGDKSDIETSPRPIPATPFKAMSLYTSPVDQGLGLTRDGCLSGMPLSWLQLGPARANRGGLYAQTLTRSRNWTRKRPVRSEHRSLRAGHEGRSTSLNQFTQQPCATSILTLASTMLRPGAICTVHRSS